MKVKLTPAQVSAMECRDWSAEPTVRRTWKGEHIEFEEADRNQLYSDLNDASNAEDAQFELRGADKAARKFAGRAARSLACIAMKVTLRG